MNHNVFISYSRKDKAFANALRQHLMDQGVSCWIDREGIAAGEDWTATIGKALRSVSIMVLVYSSGALESENVKDEVALAAKRKLPIIPIRIEDIEPDEFFEVRMARISWLDVFEKQQECLSEIAAGIKARLEKLQQSHPQQLTTSAPSTYLDSEKKYLNALCIAYDDGTLTNNEREKLNALAMELELSPARMKELESHINTENKDSAGQSAPVVTDIDEAFNWPDIGYKYLRQVLANLDRSRLPFEPIDTGDDKAIVADLYTYWQINGKYFLSIMLRNKRLNKIDVRWGIYSENSQRDPQFRQACNELYQIPDIGDGDSDVSINGYIYKLESTGDYLGFETSKRMSFSELNNSENVNLAIEQVIAFTRKVWPVVRKRLNFNSEEQSISSDVSGALSMGAEQAATTSTTTVWPDIGIKYLREVLSKLDISRLPFKPQEISDDESIVEDTWTYWQINDKYFISIMLPNKRMNRVDVRWGIYSESTQRDPIFRQACNDFRQIPDILNDDGDALINGYVYRMDSTGDNLGFEACQRKTFSELNNPDYANHVVEQLIVFTHKIWPVVQANLLK